MMLHKVSLFIMVAMIITFDAPLYGMEKSAIQKTHCITTYSKDNKKSLVPLVLVRESNVLYKEYCKKVSNKEERLFLKAPVLQKDLDLFVDGFSFESNVRESFKEYYCGLDCKKQHNLLSVALGLKSPWACAAIVSCYHIPQDIRNHISSFLLKKAAESVRCCRILSNSKKSWNSYLTSEMLDIGCNQWGTVYEGNGQYYKAPLCVIENDSAMWGGKRGFDRKIKKGEDIYHQDGSCLTLNTKDKDVILYDDMRTCVRSVFSNDGQWFAIGSYVKPYEVALYLVDPQKKIVVIGCLEGSQINALTYRWNNQINALCFNYRSTLLAIGFSNDSDNVLVLQRIPENKEEISSGKKKYKELKGHTKGVWSVQFSGDDKRLLSCSKAEAILWNVEDYDNIAVIKVITWEKQPTKVFFSKYGSRIVAITGSDYSVYDGCNGELIGNDWPCDDPVGCGLYHAVFSDDGKFFLTITSSDSRERAHFKLWNAQTGTVIKNFHKAYQDSNALGFTPDLRYIIDANISSKDRSYINRTELYDTQDAQDIKKIVDYKPTDLFDAYCVWRACKAVDDENVYGGTCLSDDVKKIIELGVRK